MLPIFTPPEPSFWTHEPEMESKAMVERTASRFALAVALLVVASSAQAVVKPPDSPVREKAFRHSDLDVRSPHQPLSSLQASTAAVLEQELTALGVPRDHGFYDV